MCVEALGKPFYSLSYFLRTFGNLWNYRYPLQLFTFCLLIAILSEGNLLETEMDLEHGFKLGEWTVLPRQSSLVKDGESVHIQPKVMGVLVCLAQHAPETVTREEIFAEVWAGRIVQDQVLDTNISILRSHFETETNEPAYIKTIHGVGYLLLVETQPLTAIRTTKSRASGRLLVAAIIVVALALFNMIPEKSDPDAAPDIGFNNKLVQVEPPDDLESALRTIKLTSLLLLSGNQNVARRGTEFLKKSISLFTNALVADSTLIAAHIGLANAYALLPSYDGSVPDIMFANARVELQLAIDLGAEVGRTYAIEAFMHLR